MSKHTEQLLSSTVFVVLVTKGYLEDVRNGDKEITEQISLAKEFDKPCFLVCLDLSDEQVKEAENIFKEHRTIKIFTSTKREFQTKARHFVREMKKWYVHKLSNGRGISEHDLD